MSPPRLRSGLLLAAGLLLALPAQAVRVGDFLYIRAKDVRVLKSASVKAQPVALLQPGARVTWRGADKKNRLLHKVEFQKEGESAPLAGYVLQANLSPNKPSPEYLLQDSGKPIDAQSFKSSGAATKALGGMALDYASKKNLTGLPEKLMALEAISASVDAQAVDARARQLGLACGEAPAPAPDAEPTTTKKVKRKKKKGAPK